MLYFLIQQHQQTLWMLHQLPVLVVRTFGKKVTMVYRADFTLLSHRSKFALPAIKIRSIVSGSFIFVNERSGYLITITTTNSSAIDVLATNRRVSNQQRYLTCDSF